MKKFWILFLLAGFLFTGCISISSPDVTPTTPPQFVTATLPPTKALVLPPTTTPLTPVTDGGTRTPVPTEPTDCKVQAVLLEDVTIPDDTLIPAGKTFTKTWRFKNNGTCHWKGFTINYLTGDRMGAPDSAPIPDTVAGETVEVSLDLTAPEESGSYAGYFTLKDADGNSINVGTEKTFWLKIMVGDGGESGGAFESTTVSIADCDFETNPIYVEQLQTLINDERQKNELPELQINSQLTTAAQNHATDMACNSLLSHTSSEGLSLITRIWNTGYIAAYTEEIIYVSDTPQQAFDWWMADEPHRDVILNTQPTEMGIGYAYIPSSSQGGYFTVDFARP